MRLLNWNVEFAPPGRTRAAAIAGVIERHEPDIVCLTETHATWPMEGGHWIWPSADYGYRGDGERRKVGLWSRAPWSEVDEVGHPGLPGGRFVAGVTETDVGPLIVMGVCIPWRMAHVATGRRDRAAWQDHLDYLDGLGELVAERASPGPLVVVGDFNQGVPRRHTPVAVHDALLAALGPLTIVTAGPVAGLDAGVIDHVAIGPELSAHEVTGISRLVDGKQVSDHTGVVVRLAAA